MDCLAEGTLVLGGAVDIQVQKAPKSAPDEDLRMLGTWDAKVGEDAGGARCASVAWMDDAVTTTQDGPPRMVEIVQDGSEDWFFDDS